MRIYINVKKKKKPKYTLKHAKTIWGSFYRSQEAVLHSSNEN